MDLMAKIRQDPSAAQRAMQSPDGQALLQMLCAGGNDQLQQAMAKAEAGDTAQLSAMLRQIMQSPEGAALIRSIGSSLTK